MFAVRAIIDQKVTTLPKFSRAPCFRMVRTVNMARCCVVIARILGHAGYEALGEYTTMPESASYTLLFESFFLEREYAIHGLGVLPR